HRDARGGTAAHHPAAGVVDGRDPAMSERTPGVHRVAVVGSGYMGGGIAQVLALAGSEVRIADVDLAVAEANHARLVEEAAAFAAEGLFPVDAAETVRTRITPAALAEAVDGAQFIEEAVPERLELK